MQYPVNNTCLTSETCCDGNCCSSNECCNDGNCISINNAVCDECTQYFDELKCACTPINRGCLSNQNPCGDTCCNEGQYCRSCYGGVGICADIPGYVSIS